jgi:hypothetical protein
LVHAGWWSNIYRMKTDQATLVSRDLKSLPRTDATSVR